MPKSWTWDLMDTSSSVASSQDSCRVINNLIIELSKLMSTSVILDPIKLIKTVPNILPYVARHGLDNIRD